MKKQILTKIISNFSIRTIKWKVFSIIKISSKTKFFNNFVTNKFLVQTQQNISITQILEFLCFYRRQKSQIRNLKISNLTQITKQYRLIINKRKKNQRFIIFYVWKRRRINQLSTILWRHFLSRILKRLRYIKLYLFKF